MPIPTLHNNLQIAAKSIGKTWPLYGFVTSNPLSGYENQPFRHAVQEAGGRLAARVYPDAPTYRRAYQEGEIADAILLPLLQEQGFSADPHQHLRTLEAAGNGANTPVYREVDRLTAKWLGAFLDEGLSEWSMPGREAGFYGAWRRLAPYDRNLNGLKGRALPETAAEALSEILAGFPEKDHANLMAWHLEALPGWAGYIRYRAEEGTAWQQQYPIDLEDYLAVRLLIASAVKAPLAPPPHRQADETHLRALQHLWLTAWEQTWQQKLLGNLAGQSDPPDGTHTAPDAQLVFCIDTRSEPIRRQVEATGNYETFGYAGFFGIAMDYENPDSGLVRKSCPPIVASAYRVAETARPGQSQAVERFRKNSELRAFYRYFLKRMKNMLPATFGFVEGSGLAYGATLMARTWNPRWWYRQALRLTPAPEHHCAPEIGHTGCGPENAVQLPLSTTEKTAVVKSAFDLMGWQTFAPLVVFVGHGSHSANNPFGSSLDCGACAASPGRHNARTLARLANEGAVREALWELHGVHIPAETVFLGAEHNTTTDAITLFDAEVPDSHQALLRQLREDLGRAQEAAARLRLGLARNGAALAEQKAGDWSETRPEWGLAGNAGFVIGPRNLTQNHNLEGRCFLHSYNWKHDPSGKALEAILQGPMVVTQWINNHYYFATVDPGHFGSGSKITQNPTGQFGVIQGNGGDLKAGLPLQSVCQTDTEAYHRPLRLTVVIQAPLERVDTLLRRNKNLGGLVANQWIHLLVLDPLEGNRVIRYGEGLTWEPDRVFTTDVKPAQSATVEKIACLVP